MKALDKDIRQVITGIGDKFTIEAKVLIWRRAKTRKTVSVTIEIQKKNPTEFIKVKVNGTLNDVLSYKLYDSIDLKI